MMERLALIGFGEAAQAFAPGLSAVLAAYDRKTDDPATVAAKLSDFERFGVAACCDPAGALAGASAALSLVTADQALAAAEASARIVPGSFWFDMNSVAPATKRAAARSIASHGGRYVDVAVMAPVHPKRVAVPLLVAGADADDGAAMLRMLGFADVTVVAGPVGAATSIKMIRSVMVKGIEAMSLECALAADAAGVLDEVIASLDASWPGAGWGARFDYNLDRMIVHGRRRAAEMEEVVATLDALGTGSDISRGTARRQRTVGALALSPPDGLAAKLAALKDRAA